MNIELPGLVLFSSFAVLLLALFFTFLRLVKGPDIYNRIASMDLIASIIMAFILVYSIFIGKAMYIDVVIVISLISFVGTVSISIYLRQKSKL